MAQTRLFDPTKSISIGFLAGFLVIGGLLAYVSSLNKTPSSYDTRARAGLSVQSKSCSGNGSCMTTSKCAANHWYNTGKYNCVGTLICCSSVPTPTPTPVQTLAMNPKTVSVTVMAGSQVKAFDLTSTGATGFTMYGYPTSYGPGINWSPSSGGIQIGSTIPINISVNATTPTGTYTGTGRLNNLTDNTYTLFPVTVVVQ